MCTAAKRSRGSHQSSAPRSPRQRGQAVDGAESVASRPLMERQLPMAKATVEVLIDDLDGSDGAQTVTLGWNGDWRELDLSNRNLSSLSRTLDRYWGVGRPV